MVQSRACVALITALAGPLCQSSPCGVSPVPFLELNGLQRGEIFGESVISIQARVRVAPPVDTRVIGICRLGGDHRDAYAARTCPRSATVNLKRWWLHI